jgi:predicted acylesterase/phospholipase RssA
MWEDARYVSFASAGTRGLVYLGFLDAMEDRLGTQGYEAWRAQLRGAAGTSAGSCAALVLLLGLDRTARRETLEEMSDMRNVVRCPDVGQLLRHYGWEDGRAFKELVQRVLMRGGLSAHSTLGDVRRLLRQEFVCVATDLHTGRALHLSAETHPTTKVYDAVYASCCVPFMFVPAKVDGRLLADGCLACNVPEVFAEDETLFVDLATDDEDHPIGSWMDYLHGIVRCTVVAQGRGTWQRRAHSIRLPPSLLQTPAFDVHQSAETAESLFRAGYASTLDALRGGVCAAAGEALRLYLTLTPWESEAGPDGA